MQIDFIRYHEIEELLRNFQTLKGMREVLQAQIQSVMTVDSDENGAIESLTFKRNLDGLPKDPNIVQDRTGNIVAGLRKNNQETAGAIREIISDLLLVDTVILKLQIGLKVLLPDERKTVELRYLNNLNWQEIADEMATSISTVQRHRRAGIEKIRVVSRISVDDYERIMKILNLKIC